MIPIHINKVTAIHNSIRFKTEIQNQQSLALQNLNNLRNRLSLTNQNEITYLDWVIQLFNQSSFITQTPNEIDNTVNGCMNLPVRRLDNNGNVLKRQLTHEIQEALEYVRLRKNFYPKYFREIGIKSCVYCNSQLTVVLVKSANNYDARLEVDHHYAKSDYPFLSISLFNLYPCCSSCNKRKSSTPVNFKLYTDDITKLKKSDYNFNITPKSKCNFLLSKDSETIEINFIDNSTRTNNTQLLQNVFSVKEIHNTQKDIIAELIIKSQIYTDTFKKQLLINFSKLSISNKDFDRVIVGNYTEEKDMHKRPFSKMTMDIAQQLNLIKK